MEKPKNKRVKAIRKKIGAPPGTLVYTGKWTDDPAAATIIRYNEQIQEPRHQLSKKDMPELKKPGFINWINITGLHNTVLIKDMGTHFGVHDLVLEDILNINHLPKSEDYETYLFFTLKMLSLSDDADTKFEQEQISFILGNGFLVSFQEREGDLFDPIRERINSAAGRITKRSEDYLLYALTDVIVDNYYLVIEHINEEIADLEEELLDSPTRASAQKIAEMRGKIIHLKKTIYPAREAIRKLVREESALIDEQTLKYFTDIYDHLLHIVQTMESQRETLSGFMDLYMSNISNRMNHIMQTLTIIATIFIPLTFIAGIYGMNFDFMPELHWKWGYFAVWGIMLAVTGGLIIFFKRQKWW